MPREIKALTEELQTAAAPSSPDEERIRAEWMQAEAERDLPPTPNWLS